MLSESMNILRWARWTMMADLRRYRSKSQPVSGKRLWHAVVPNLQRPIFVVAAPRSGTTFLGQCLAALPEISYHFEPIATKIAARYVYQEKWSYTKARFFYRQVYSWLMRIHFDGHLRFAEKTPRNCFIVPFLFKAFPDAQFVHIIRDGRDAALSHSKKPWLRAASQGSGEKEPGGYLHGPYARFWVEREEEFETTTDIHRCIWAWRRHAESALAAGTYLPTSQYHEVRYESLVSNSREEAERLLNFLDVSDPFARHQFHDAVAHANQDSVGRWQHELSAEQLVEIEREAGPLLRQLGYLS